MARRSLNPGEARRLLTPSRRHLVNDAGIFGPKDVFVVPGEDWARIFETNVMSGVRLSRAYMPRIRRTVRRRDQNAASGHRRS
jgi:NAD(P)-dependent dehydrogenase (short-subunit alcohol dehydrogenase family)